MKPFILFIFASVFTFNIQGSSITLERKQEFGNSMTGNENSNGNIPLSGKVITSDIIKIEFPSTELATFIRTIIFGQSTISTGHDDKPSSYPTFSQFHSPLSADSSPQPDLDSTFEDKKLNVTSGFYNPFINFMQFSKPVSGKSRKFYIENDNPSKIDSFKNKTLIRNRRFVNKNISSNINSALSKDISNNSSLSNSGSVRQLHPSEMSTFSPRHSPNIEEGTTQIMPISDNISSFEELHFDDISSSKDSKSDAISSSKELQSDEISSSKDSKPDGISSPKESLVNQLKLNDSLYEFIDSETQSTLDKPLKRNIQKRSLPYPSMPSPRAPPSELPGVPRETGPVPAHKKSTGSLARCSAATLFVGQVFVQLMHRMFDPGFTPNTPFRGHPFSRHHGRNPMNFISFFLMIYLSKKFFERHNRGDRREKKKTD